MFAKTNVANLGYLSKHPAGRAKEGVPFSSSSEDHVSDFSD